MPEDPLESLRGGVMPCCGNPLLVQPGPRGGLARNYRCAHCGAEWDVSPLHAVRIDGAFAPLREANTGRE